MCVSCYFCRNYTATEITSITLCGKGLTLQFANEKENTPPRFEVIAHDSIACQG